MGWGEETFAFTSETTVRVNQSQLKDWKRLLHAALRGILFNEALTDGLCLKSQRRAHPDTDRTLSDNLYHSDKPHREEVEIGSWERGTKKKKCQALAENVWMKTKGVE